MQNQDIEFFFMPFSELELSRKAPVVAYVFEGQGDTEIDSKFPEIEHQRKMTDENISKNEDDASDTVLFFPIQRDDKMYLAGIVYIALSWKHKRKFDVDSINFYNTVKERSVVMVESLREMREEEAVILLPGPFHPRNLKSEKQKHQLLLFVQTLTESILYGNNTLDDFTVSPKPQVRRITFTYFGQYESNVNAFFQKAIGDGRIIGNALAYVRRLIELPPNKKYPSKFVECAVGKLIGETSAEDGSGKSVWKTVTGHNFSAQTRVSVICGLNALRNYGKHGFGLIAGVGQGSAHEPCLLKVHYRPHSRRQKPIKKISLIGKGVTFDTGGVDLKLTGAYNQMHYDMTGAATVLGAIRIAEEKNLSVEIVGLVPIVHNAIAPDALHPHDIITAFNGKNIEIINTDSEGRLIVADALAYSEEKIRPDCTITLATLCGMEDVTLDILKVLATNVSLEKRARIAEGHALEKIMLWPRLEYMNAIDDEYRDETNADLKNDISFGYHSAGLVFISDFLDWERPLNWVYIDLSAVFNKEALDYSAGPGFGLRFLWNFIKQFA